ncbi:uncharacterized protein LOC141755894 isoform X2 [Sebastes fasciatus]|uniref:uncharacterized protein LOC141755894 isoform X2 n=1 Tax=Sebastes fasciatus TaxID=394691 RepID=UPI003D9DBEA3
MAGIVHVVMRLLLLLSLITSGVNGEDGLILAEQGFDISVPCEEESVCLYMWQLSTSTSDYIAIVRNGEIQTATSEYDDSKCTLEIKDLTAEDVGRHRCQQRPDFFSPLNTSSELNLMSGKTLSLQCILLTYVEAGHFYTDDLHQVRLAWVDEAGTEIQQDSQHQIKQESLCDVTLTVSLQSPDNRKFRCQATVGEQVQTSVEFPGGNQDVIGAAVGVVGCVALTALVALFVVNRRRTNSQLPDESSSTTSTNNGMNADDDVIYADIIFPVGPPDRVWVYECESTEYACVRYK